MRFLHIYRADVVLIGGTDVLIGGTDVLIGGTDVVLIRTIGVC